MPDEIILRPPAPAPGSSPLRPGQLLRAVLFNPIDIWNSQHFTESVVVSRTPLGTRVVVSDPAAVKWILADNAANYVRDSLQRRVVLRTTGRSLFSAEGADWRLQRRALAPFFSPKAVAGYLPAMMAAGEACVLRLGGAPDTLIDLPGAMAAVTADVIGRTLFPGALTEPPDAIARSVRLFADSAGAVGVEDLLGLPLWAQGWRWLQGRGAEKSVRRRARSIVAARAADGPDASVVGALETARDAKSGRRLTAREVEDNVSTLIGAGSDTVAAALTWTIFLLSQAPAARKKVETEIDMVCDGGALAAADLERLVWTRAVFEEAMRLYPPAPLIGRAALAADSFSGLRVAAGTVVLIAPWVLHRHALLWKNPDAFVPERFLPEARDTIPRYAFLPFGAGPRACIGTGFAMQEGLALLAALLRKLRFERADDRPVRLVQCVTLQPQGGLRMLASRRSASLAGRQE